MVVPELESDGRGVELLDGDAGSLLWFILMITSRVVRVEFGFSCITLGSAQGGNLTSLLKEKQPRLIGGQRVTLLLARCSRSATSSQLLSVSYAC